MDDVAPVHVETCLFCHRSYAVEPGGDEEWFCTECGKPFSAREDLEQNNSISHRYALLGFLLLVPAFAWPMLVIEQFGQRTVAGFLQGVYTLWQHDEHLLAIVIGLFSGLFPLLKLSGMIVLTSHWFTHLRWNRMIYALVAFTGRWGMLDVFLAAVTLFGFRFSELFRIEVRSGIAAFSAMVICNLVSWAYFDTKIYGERES